MIKLKPNVSDDSLSLCAEQQTIKRLSPNVWKKRIKPKFETVIKEELPKAMKNNYIAQRYNTEPEFRDYHSDFSKRDYKKNRDERIDKQNAHNKMNQESIKEYQKQHYENNRDERKTYSKQYYEKNKPRYKKYNRKYYKDHKEQDNGH